MLEFFFFIEECVFFYVLNKFVYLFFKGLFVIGISGCKNLESFRCFRDGEVVLGFRFMNFLVKGLILVSRG